MAEALRIGVRAEGERETKRDKPRTERGEHCFPPKQTGA